MSGWTGSSCNTFQEEWALAPNGGGGFQNAGVQLLSLFASMDLRLVSSPLLEVFVKGTRFHPSYFPSLVKPLAKYCKQQIMLILSKVFACQMMIRLFPTSSSQMILRVENIGRYVA